jgi:hypothetical protein
MATEQKIACGSVDGKGLVCAFYLREKYQDRCLVDDWWWTFGQNPHPCHCNAARLAALAKQDPELMGLVREIAKFGSIAYDDEEKECPFCGERVAWGDIIKHEPYCLIARARAALAERGVEV